ncbi:hypothetical protein J8I87_14000, partial [Paraburkholderia sp. LEh10]|uniref:hypothetical protein n=1 Tax=Paraburkholderia sp. LEh10 TaxID=2821353 RepID=UPI001AE4B7F8
MSANDYLREERGHVAVSPLLGQSWIRRRRANFRHSGKRLKRYFGTAKEDVQNTVGDADLTTYVSPSEINETK